MKKRKQKIVVNIIGVILFVALLFLGYKLGGLFLSINSARDNNIISGFLLIKKRIPYKSFPKTEEYIKSKRQINQCL